MKKTTLRYTDSNKPTSLTNVSKLFISVATLFPFGCLTASAQNLSHYNCVHTVETGCMPLETVRQTSTRTQTNYPVIMTHGTGGVGPLPNSPSSGSFYGIPKALAAGGTLVFQTTSPAFNRPEVRGEYIYTQMQYAKAITNTDKFNLIGHSHGGQDMRYIAGAHTAEVASVTTVSTANKGTGFAEFLSQTKDAINSVDQSETVTTAIAGVFNTWGNIFGALRGIELEQDAFASLASLNYDGMASFNQRFPHGVPADCATRMDALAKNGVRYYSWTGDRIFTNAFDPSDYAMAATGAFIKETSDGLVSPCSSHLGHWVRDDYHLNHFDTANLFFGLRSWRSQNPVTLFTNHVNRLKNIDL